MERTRFEGCCLWRSWLGERRLESPRTSLCLLSDCFDCFKRSIEGSGAVAGAAGSEGAAATTESVAGQEFSDSHRADLSLAKLWLSIVT